MKGIQENDTRRLVRTLDEEIRSRGYGSICAVDRAAGYSEGWWQHRAESGNISMIQLLKVLDHLGLDPVSFIRRALGRGNELELDRPRGQPPLIVTKAWDRCSLTFDGSGVGTAYLETLEQQRYEEPREVVRLAEWAVDHVELDLLPRLLGVAGSALRLLIRLDDAEHAVCAGIEIAQARGSRSSVYDLLQRLAYVVGDRGDYVRSLRLSEVAAIGFLRLNDQTGMSRALVDQGIWLSRLDRPSESIEAMISALQQLDAEDYSNRFTALQVLGLSYRELGEFGLAVEKLAEAERLAPKVSSLLNAKAIWLRGMIYVDLDELELAETHIGEAVAVLSALHFGEAALATCDLVHVLLRRGKFVEACEATLSMRALVSPLSRNKVVSSAIAALLRSGQAGVTPALVGRVKAQIESERRNQASWSNLKAGSKAS